MGLYAVGLELEAQQCLVVGGGAVAERKVESLLEAGARVTVIAPEVSLELLRLEEAGRIRCVRREYRSSDMDGYALVMAATDAEPVNRQVSSEGRIKKVPVNVCDRPELCTFIVPAVVKQGSLTLAIFTKGKSPMLSRRIREDLQAQFGPEYAEFLEILGSLRSLLQRELPEQSRRQAVYERLVYSEALQFLRAGQRDKVEAMVAEAVAQVQAHAG